MPNGTRCPVDLESNSKRFSAMTQYSILPQGAFSTDDLLEVGQARTALAYTLRDDRYNLTFFRREADGKVGSPHLIWSFRMHALAKSIAAIIPT